MTIYITGKFRDLYNRLNNNLKMFYLNRSIKFYEKIKKISKDIGRYFMTLHVKEKPNPARYLLIKHHVKF